MATPIQFVKMHGLGNDFIVVDCLTHPHTAELLARQARSLCDRHFGIGGDGLILVMPSVEADFRMRIINSDGSEAEMCGNGMRCLAKYAFEHGLTAKRAFTVSTLAGPITPALILAGDAVSGVRVDMGEPRLERAEVPIYGPPGQVVNEPLSVANQTLRITAVSMGNPHAVVFVEDLDSFPVETLGPLIEKHPAFPRKSNVEFVEVRGPRELRMRAWERGAGLTLACGTGACAALVAAVLTGNGERAASVELPGGALQIEWSDETNHVCMTGPAVEVFAGTILLV